MPRRPYLPLRGIRVLSFEIAFSLPAGTRTLAELGAEVVRIAGPARAAGTYIAVIDGVFLSKSCIGINLKHEEGREIARRLVAEADVVCNNFTPDTMAAFGLAPADIHAIRSDAIVAQVSGYGSPGPWANYPAYGPSTEAAGGLNALMGDATDDPVRIGSGVFSDQLSGRFAALAILAALERRRRTGEGQIIDLSMTEAITTLLGPDIVRTQMTKQLPSRYGDHDAVFAPQGVYPCGGTDSWIAITVKDDAQWAALVNLVGSSELVTPAFASADGRRAAHDAIDAAIGGWTGQQDRFALATLLQQHGIAAGPVRAPADAHFDEHLRKRDAFQRIQHAHPILGRTEHPHLRNPWRVDGFERPDLSDFRYTGADNARVLRKWLGLAAKEVRRLAADGALLDVGQLVVTERPAAPGTPVDGDAPDRIGLARAGAP